MKIAILGRGKTGSQVIKLASERGLSYTSFHRDNVPTQDNLKGHDVIISFLAGDILSEYLPLLKSLGIPVVSGSTGHDFSQVQEVAWIQGNNFSLGMNVVRLMIESLHQVENLFANDLSFKIHEVHHTQKKDAPSGTALSWERWLGKDATITSERTGDVVGDHQLEVQTPFEKISLRHEALDRQIFAEGALWASDYVLTKKLDKGFYWFEDIVRNELIKKVSM